MKKWARAGAAVLLAGVLLWALLQLWIALAVGIAASYGLQAGMMFILLSLSVVIWLVWFVGAGWHAEGHSARPGGSVGREEPESR
jgi:hypothetical protein